MKKTITAACALILTLASASCQKSTTEQFLNMQEEMIELMENIKDQSSANKAAEKIAKLRAESKELENSMSQEEKKKMWVRKNIESFCLKKNP